MGYGRLPRGLQGKTAEDLARENDYHDIAQILQGPANCHRTETPFPSDPRKLLVGFAVKGGGSLQFNAPCIPKLTIFRGLEPGELSSQDFLRYCNAITLGSICACLIWVCFLVVCAYLPV